MPPKKKSGGGKGSNGGGQSELITIRAGRFKLDMPMPRLPLWIGTPNLRANVSVYPRLNLDVPIGISTIGIAAGAVAQVLNIDTSQVPNWATRFGATFKEFAIVGARFELRVTEVTAAPQGMLLAYIDENSNAAPTATAVNYAHAEIPLVNTSADTTGSIHKVEWVARSYADLTWDGIGTSGVVGYLKIFGNAANTGLSASTAGVVTVSGAFAVCFRGYI